MSLSTALLTSLTGLKSSQTGMETVSANVANAQTPGYTRKDVRVVAQLTEDHAVGVRVSEITRQIDSYLQRQTRVEASGLSYAQTKADALARLQQMFGQPGGKISLDTLFNSFQSSFDTLVTTPDSPSARGNLLSNAQLLAQTLNGLSDDVQSMRTEADRALQDATGEVNKLLQDLKDLNGKILPLSNGRSPPPDLLDQRDSILDQLADFMDIRVINEGAGVSVFTSSGISLFSNGQAAKLTFDRTPMIGPQAQYSANPAQRTVGTIMLYSPAGLTVDLLATGGLTGGSIRANADLRDDILVEAQTQLDEVAASMARALGTRQIEGSPGAPTAPATQQNFDLAQLAKPGDRMSVTVSAGGVTRTFTFVRTENPATTVPNTYTADPNDIVIPLDFSAGATTAAGNAATALGTALTAAFGAGHGFTTSSATSTLTVDADGTTANAQVSSSRAEVASLSLTGGLDLPFFLDGGKGGQPFTDDPTGLGQRTGFAGRIQLNQNLLENPSGLVVYQAGILPSDNARPTFMRDAMINLNGYFRVDTGIGGQNDPFQGSIGQFVQRIVEFQGRASEQASRIRDGQQVVVNSLKDRLTQDSGVDIDTEMGKLIQLQTSYQANARVMTAAKEMLDLLMKM